MSNINKVFNPKFGNLINELDQLSPRFEISSNQIEILKDPKEFYSTLKQKINNAQNRIFISSLYIGKNQDELIQCISNSLESKPNLKVYILTDALRGTRETPSKSSASLLSKLLIKYESQVDIRMYHTPHLNGIKKSIVPKRFNEGFGLQHMKIYGFDDELILSGANLSNDYFNNRQDRYYLFKSNQISNYFFNIQKLISQLSYKLYHNKNKLQFELKWPQNNPIIEPNSKNIHRFIKESSKLLTDFLKLKSNSFESDNFKSTSNTSTTYVYPVSQFSPLMQQNSDQSTEKRSIFKILNYINENSNIKWWFTAGYFNMLPEIKSNLLNSENSGEVITASPLANGFYKSKGISGMLPDAYLYLAKKFLNDIYNSQRQKNIVLKEWQRGIVNTVNGWSYHAKGLWVSSPGENKPSLTIIGSSNYTRRAYNFDLESNVIIVTNDEILKDKMQDELNNLNKYTKPLELEDFEKNDKKISKIVILLTKLLGKRL
ncbi:hypothetical protein WICMUC_000728 [Wickerhamomyces mucosus]|uniref:CDP-diacylglycerol--glycerol-3-phosphate 3-phosphatidyltransferase n=1 Tax=Wickerhamomyces mucosus TaxID=1378264 RepID=A0A9P8PX30_9ASCO|nr:hypothetical protein WICMUC_000728 [Wickerhamomyces mucosus]